MLTEVSLAQKFSDVINKTYKLILKDQTLNKDLNDYFMMIGVNKNNQQELSNSVLTYIFERRLGSDDDKKTIFELILKSNKKEFNKDETKLVKALQGAISSIFEIKKVLKDGFELYNLVNEKIYKCNALSRMTDFRGVASGEFFVGRVVLLDGEYYLYQINEHIKFKDKEKALRLAVSRQMYDLNAIYQDNPEKLTEIKDLVKSTKKKFKKFFGSDEVITTSEVVDDLISAFNDFVELDETIAATELKSLIKEPAELHFFEVDELTKPNTDLFESASKGFSSHKKHYDVGIAYDNETGLQIIPFYKTFQHIFESDDFTSIDGYQKCIWTFVKGAKIPNFILKKVSEKNPEKFIKIINDVLGEKFADYEEFALKYKKENSSTFSSTIVLYTSKVFKDLMNYIGRDKAIASEKAGRNELCPCGSGLKYKKCCLQKLSV